MSDVERMDNLGVIVVRVPGFRIFRLLRLLRICMIVKLEQQRVIGGRMNRKYEIPNSDEVDLARASAAVLTKLLQDLPHDERASIRMGGQDLIVPRSAVELLRDILAGMSAGKSISIVPMAKELTTQQAADFLNVSRPYLIGLLERKELSFTLVGTHRRIRFDDLLDYRERMVASSKGAMDELIALSQDLRIGH